MVSAVCLRGRGGKAGRGMMLLRQCRQTVDATPPARILYPAHSTRQETVAASSPLRALTGLGDSLAARLQPERRRKLRKAWTEPEDSYGRRTRPERRPPNKLFPSVTRTLHMRSRVRATMCSLTIPLHVIRLAPSTSWRASATSPPVFRPPSEAHGASYSEYENTSSPWC